MEPIFNFAQQALEQLVTKGKACYYIKPILKKTSVLDSKIGGIPYLPKGTNYPTSSQGEPLYLIAQLNISKLKGGTFPLETGILQFWGMNRSDYGCHTSLYTTSDTCPVLYYPMVEPAHTEDELLELYPFLGQERETFPISHPDGFGMDFSSGLCPITPTEDDFEIAFVEAFSTLTSEYDVQSFGELFQMDELQADDILTAYIPVGHKLLGYGTPMAKDPRDEVDCKDYVLLFHLDSDDIEEQEISWGDCGLAHWYIHPKDLEEGNFSNVLFLWEEC